MTAVILIGFCGCEMKRDYGTNGNNCRSAGFQRACLKDVQCPENMQAGSLRTDSYFRLFRNLSSFSINPLLSTLPVAVTQQVLLNLAGRRPRECINNINNFRAFKMGHLIAAKSDQFLLTR